MDDRDSTLREGDIVGAERRFERAIARRDVRAASRAIDALSIARGKEKSEESASLFLNDLDRMITHLEGETDVDGPLAVALSHRLYGHRRAGRHDEANSDAERMIAVAGSDGIGPARRAAMISNAAKAAARLMQDGDVDRATQLATCCLDLRSHPDLLTSTIASLPRGTAESLVILGRFSEARRAWRQARQISVTASDRRAVLDSVRYLSGIVVSRESALGAPASAVLGLTWDWHRAGENTGSHWSWNQTALRLSDFGDTAKAVRVWGDTMSMQCESDEQTNRIMTSILRPVHDSLSRDAADALVIADILEDSDSSKLVVALARCIRVAALDELGDVDSVLFAVSEATSALRNLPATVVRGRLALITFPTALRLMSPTSEILREILTEAIMLPALPAFPSAEHRYARMILGLEFADGSAGGEVSVSALRRDVEAAADDLAVIRVLLEFVATGIVPALGSDDDGAESESAADLDPQELENVYDFLLGMRDQIDENSALEKLLVSMVASQSALTAALVLWYREDRTDSWIAAALRDLLASLRTTIDAALRSDAPRAGFLAARTLENLEVFRDEFEAASVEADLDDMISAVDLRIALKLDAHAARSIRLGHREHLLGMADHTWHSALERALREKDHHAAAEIIAARRASIVFARPMYEAVEPENASSPLKDIEALLQEDLFEMQDVVEIPRDLARAASPLVLRFVDPDLPAAPRAHVRLPDGSIALSSVFDTLDSGGETWLSPWVVPLA